MFGNYFEFSVQAKLKIKNDKIKFWSFQNLTFFFCFCYDFLLLELGKLESP